MTLTVRNRLIFGSRRHPTREQRAWPGVTAVVLVYMVSVQRWWLIPTLELATLAKWAQPLVRWHLQRNLDKD